MSNQVKIAMTSCVKVQNQSVQPVWDAIDKFEPTILVLGGDNIYAHQKKLKKDYMIEKYERQYISDVPNYKKLLDKMTPNIVSVWDDHDFGKNNSKGDEEPQWWKDFVKEQFVKYNYWSADRVPETAGIYHSYLKDGVKFIMLDVRTFRTKARKCFGLKKYPNRKFLGDAQWLWLEKELVHDGAIVIVSGSTFSRGKDGWKNYPEERERFLKVCMGIKSPVTLLSGDIHTNKLVHYYDGMGNIMTEVTSSGAGRDNLDNWAEVIVDSELGLRYYLFHGDVAKEIDIRL